MEIGPGLKYKHPSCAHHVSKGVYWNWKYETATIKNDLTFISR